MPDNPDAYMADVAQASQQYGVPPQLLQAEILARSGGSPMGSGIPDGGHGIMNLSPGEASQFGVMNPMDVRGTIQQMAQYLAQQYQKFGDWRHAVAAMASNPALVAYHGGIPPLSEVETHVGQVMQHAGLPDVGAASPGSPTGVGASPGLGSSAPTNPLQHLHQLISGLGGYPAAPPDKQLPGTQQGQGQGKQGSSSSVPPGGLVGTTNEGKVLPGHGILLPASFHSTHDTDGLPGYPAIDVFGKAGTKVRAPANGIVKYVHMIPWDGTKRVGGMTFYIVTPGGGSYFLTHFGQDFVREGEHIREGQVIGTIAKVPDNWWQSHIHMGYNPHGHP